MIFNHNTHFLKYKVILCWKLALNPISFESRRNYTAGSYNECLEFTDVGLDDKLSS